MLEVPQLFVLCFTQIFLECFYAWFAIDLVNNIPLTSSNLVRNPEGDTTMVVM